MTDPKSSKGVLAAPLKDSWMSSDEDYKHPNDSKEIWEQTSRWRYIQLEILRIDIEDGARDDIVGNIDITTVMLHPDSNRLLLSCADVRDSSSAMHISAEQRAFFNRLVQLTVFDDEPPVDAVASDLLTYTGFESEVLHFRPRPRFKFSFLSYEITSIPDYGVFLDRSSGHLTDEYLVVVEDKAPGNYSKHYKECQLCGEMLASALDRYNNKRDDKVVFGLILSGLDARFYRGVFSKDCLSFITRNKIPSAKTLIKRFPSASEYPLSLNRINQRDNIVRILHCIKVQLERVIVV